MAEPEYRVITPTQLAEGYFELQGMVAYRRSWQRVGRLDDGNWLVREPERPFSTPVGASTVVRYD